MGVDVNVDVAVEDVSPGVDIDGCRCPRLSLRQAQGFHWTAVQLRDKLTDGRAICKLPLAAHRGLRSPQSRNLWVGEGSRPLPALSEGLDVG